MARVVERPSEAIMADVDAQIEPQPTRRATIRAIYSAVRAPAWAAPNLDGLADVLRDLSWLEPGPVHLDWRVHPDLADDELRRVHDVLVAAVAGSARSDHPLTLHVA